MAFDQVFNPMTMFPTLLQLAEQRRREEEERPYRDLQAQHLAEQIKQAQFVRQNLQKEEADKVRFGKAVSDVVANQDTYRDFTAPIYDESGQQVGPAESTMAAEQDVVPNTVPGPAREAPTVMGGKVVPFDREAAKSRAEKIRAFMDARDYMASKPKMVGEIMTPTEAQSFFSFGDPESKDAELIKNLSSEMRLLVNYKGLPWVKRASYKERLDATNEIIDSIFNTKSKATAEGKAEGTPTKKWQGIPQKYTAALNDAEQQKGSALTPEDVYRVTQQYDKAVEDRRFNKQLTMEQIREANREKLRKIPTGGAVALTKDDINDIADGIVVGNLPPILTGLYRNSGAVTAALAKRGYNLAEASNEYNAVKRYMASINSPQQTRLRQAVRKVDDHVDMIQDLRRQWEAKAATSDLKMFNRANLALAKQRGGPLGSIATNMEAQIVDLQAELAAVYMGGNTPTDHAMKEAAKNLEGEWDAKTFDDAVKYLKRNVQMRENAIRSIGPAGVKEESPYLPTDIKEGVKENKKLTVVERRRGKSGRVIELLSDGSKRYAQ